MRGGDGIKLGVQSPPIKLTPKVEPVQLATLDGSLHLHRKSLASQFLGKVFASAPGVSKNAITGDSPNACVLSILLDTGNLLYDIISEKLQQKLNLEIVAEDILHVKCANNQVMSVLGRTKNRMYLQVKRNGLCYAFRPLVVKHLIHPVNLSSAFCARHNAVLHFRDKMLKFPRETVKLKFPHKTINVQSLDDKETDAGDKQIGIPTVDYNVTETSAKTHFTGNNSHSEEVSLATEPLNVSTVPHSRPIKAVRQDGGIIVNNVTTVDTSTDKQIPSLPRIPHSEPISPSLPHTSQLVSNSPTTAVKSQLGVNIMKENALEQPACQVAGQSVQVLPRPHTGRRPPAGSGEDVSQPGSHHPPPKSPVLSPSGQGKELLKVYNKKKDLVESTNTI